MSEKYLPMSPEVRDELREAMNIQFRYKLYKSPEFPFLPSMGINHIIQAFEDKEHFPMFLMGNSLQTFVRAKQASANTLTDMKQHRFENSRVDMLGHPSDYYLFSGMEREEK